MNEVGAFLLKNWKSVLLIVVIVVIIGYLIAKKQYKQLKKMALIFVNQAERMYGPKMGEIKSAEVASWLMSQFKILTLLMTSTQLQIVIEEALKKATEIWEQQQAALEEEVKQIEAEERK